MAGVAVVAAHYADVGYRRLSLDMDLALAIRNELAVEKSDLLAHGSPSA